MAFTLALSIILKQHVVTFFPREEVVGRNCRFLQGPGTDSNEVARLRAAITAVPPKPVTVTLLNYTREGEPFWNALHVAPIRDADGVVEFFVGVQLNVAAAGAQDEQATTSVCSTSAPPCGMRLSHKMTHFSTTGAVRVACRSLSGARSSVRQEEQILTCSTCVYDHVVS